LNVDQLLAGRVAIGARRAAMSVAWHSAAGTAALVLPAGRAKEAALVPQAQV
jgi:hypothetical protein